MRFGDYAKLAACAVVAALALGWGALKEPLKVHFHLADGVQVKGELTSWDQQGIDGSFGRRLWTDLKADDIWKLHQRVMDQQAAEQWVNLGRVLLLTSEAQERKVGELTQRAFNRALLLDESVGELIQKARDEAVATRLKQREAQAAAEAEKLRTISPEGQPWPADPWPVLSQQEQIAAVSSMRGDAERTLAELNLTLEPVETDHFLLYTDLPRTDAARWILQLEKVYDLFQRVFYGPASANQRQIEPHGFWGKAVVIIFKDQAQFRAHEAKSFRQLVPQATVGVCHPIGPKVFVNLHRCSDEALFEWTMVHETVHGLMHRYRSPARLPAWANEGLAEHITSLALKDSPIGNARRQQGLEFVRDGGDVNAILDWNYADQNWPGPAAIGLPIGTLLVELMIKDQPLRFIEWINAIKAGEDWQEALRRHLAARPKLVEAFVQYYKVND